MYMYFGMLDSAAGLGDRAVAMAERLSAPLELGAALAWRGMTWSTAGDCPEALRMIRRARALLLAHGDLYMLTIAETVLGSTLWWMGQPRAAAASAEEIVQLIDRSGSHSYGKNVVASLGHYLGLLGDRVRAEPLLERARAQSSSTKDPNSLVGVLALRGHVELVHGDAAAAGETLELARTEARQASTKYWLVGLCLPALALARLELARVSGARTRPRPAAVDEGLAYTHRRPQFRAWALLADAAWSWYAGRRRHARRRFDECLALAEAQGNVWVGAEARRELGRALLEGGDVTEGRRLLREAADAFERMELAPCLAGVRKLLAE
jgi:tetratricopeptide (TPR) repeat protein